MKKLALITMLGIMMLQTAYAYDAAKLRIKIAGATADNRYFLCVGSAGCVSVKAGNAGMTYPMMQGNVGYVYATNIATRRLSPQPLPASCNVELKGKQTMTITGSISEGPNQETRIRNLSCRVA